MVHFWSVVASSQFGHLLQNVWVKSRSVAKLQRRWKEGRAAETKNLLPPAHPQLFRSLLAPQLQQAHPRPPAPLHTREEELFHIYRSRDPRLLQLVMHRRFPPRPVRRHYFRLDASRYVHLAPSLHSLPLPAATSDTEGSSDMEEFARNSDSH